MQIQRFRRTKNACYLGYVIQAVVNNLTSLLFVVFNAEPYGITLEQLGRLVLINFLSQLAIDALSIYIVPKFGYRKCVIVSQLSSAIGFLMLGILPLVLPPYIGIIIAVLFLAVGSGFIEVLISPIIEALPSEDKEGNMSFLHSFYCWGLVVTVAVTTLLLLVIGRERWYWLPLFWSILPFVNTALFWKAEILELKADRAHEKAPLSVLREGRFYLFIMLMLCAGASELAMVQWASFFVEVGFSVDKWVGDLLGPCMFAVLMGISRMLFAMFSHRFSVEKIMLFSAGLCVSSYLAVAFSRHAMLNIIGCALCGLSVGVMWPGALSMGTKEFRSSGTAIFSLLAIFGDLGCALGPWFLGLISDLSVKTGFATQYASTFGLSSSQPGLQLGFLFAMVFPLFMFIVLLVRVFRSKMIGKEFFEDETKRLSELG